MHVTLKKKNSQQGPPCSAHLIVYEDGGKVLVRIVGYAGGGDGTQELGLREPARQPVHVLV